jgi:hypothetical protein
VPVETHPVITPDLVALTRILLVGVPKVRRRDYRREK